MSNDNSPETRRQFLGATDVAAIAGVNPYRTPLQVWLEKTGHAAPAEPTAAMRRGLRFEPVVAEMYTEETGISTVPADRVFHPQFEFLVASPDRLACPDDAAPFYVEIKTHTPWLRDTYGPQGTDAIPDHEYLQVMWQLHVGLRAHAIEAWHADLAALFGTDELGIWHIEYNEELGDALESRAVRFWQDHVLPEVPPEPTAADVDLMRRVYPLHTERVIRADEQLESLINALREARAELARQEQHVNALTATIQAAMGDAAVLEFTGGKITWRTSKPTVRRTCDYDALKAADPDLYARVVTEQEVPGVRRFGVPRSWGKGDEE